MSCQDGRGMTWVGGRLKLTSVCVVGCWAAHRKNHGCAQLTPRAWCCRPLLGTPGYPSWHPLAILGISGPLRILGSANMFGTRAISPHQDSRGNPWAPSFPERGLLPPHQGWGRRQNPNLPVLGSLCSCLPLSFHSTGFGPTDAKAFSFSS